MLCEDDGAKWPHTKVPIPPPGVTVTPMACKIDTFENANKPNPVTVTCGSTNIDVKVLGEMTSRLGESKTGDS
ncbi:MAG: hypothetical protein IPN04_07000 [Rhodoferax sp.]|nr:hypothetical protein [Rhodoferax sp.]